METTILYITDSRLDPFLADKCIEYLLEAAEGKPIVSVSQKPLDLGTNICVGELDRVAVSIDTQLLVGLEAIDTPLVAIAEHDCIYSAEHFNFVPPDKEHFWYNDNSWLVQYKNPRFPEYDGMYSYFKRRRVQSQLVCGVEALRRAETEKLEILSHPSWSGKYPRGRIGEPGANYLERTRKLYRGVEGNHKEVSLLWKRIKRYITSYNAKDWVTLIPNLDIRHEQNFTGQRRGTNRTWNLPPWGEFYEVLNGTT